MYPYDPDLDQTGKHGIQANGMVKPHSPPIWYQNQLGCVTNRRQFLEYYREELESGRPIGPHIFVRR